MTNPPLVNVIIPVYKIKAEQLAESVESILNQTYTNIIIITIIDEGPENISKSILKNITDTRLQILDNGKNMGLPYSLNRGIDASSGKYIVRMDGDDIALSTRIEEQVEFMEAHPEIDICGTYAETFGQIKKLYRSATDDSKIKGELLWKNPLIHPSVAFRASTLKQKEIRYTPGVAEDYRLWLEMAYTYACKFAVLPKVLLRYRIHETQLTQTDSSKLIRKDKEIASSILHTFDIQSSDKELEAFSKCRLGEKMSFSEIKQSKVLMKRLLKKIPADVSNTYTRGVFAKGLLKAYIKAI